MSNGSSSPLPRSSFAAYLGRNQGPELFTRQPFVPLDQTVIPKTLSMNRPLEALLVRWSGRVDIAVANYTAVAAEAPQTILNRIRIFGTYKGAALTPIDMSGASIYAWPQLFNVRGSSTTINGVRQPLLGVPNAQVGATFGDVGTYDIDIWYLIPMWPMVVPGRRSLEISPYCWQPRDWSDTLQIQLNFGDETSFGTPAGGTVVTFSAFGSGAGTPQVSIYTRYLIMGPLRTGFRTATVVRNEQTINQNIAAVANNVRIANLAKQKTTNVQFKTGTNLLGVSAGVSVFATMLDTLTDVSQVLVDNRPIRNNQDDLTLKEHQGLQFGSVPPGGYQNFSFIDSQSIRSAFRGDLPTVVSPGAQFELVSNIVAAAANNQINMVQEQLYADADDPYWMNTR